MKPKLYPLLEQCIDKGIDYGYNHAFKHSDNPSSAYIQDCIFQAIMSEIHEWFEFEENHYE